MINKTKTTQTVTLWLNKDLVEKSKRKAVNEGMTFDEFVNDALRRWLIKRKVNF